MTDTTITSSKCNDCYRVIVPPRETCPYCGRSAGPMEIVELSNRGKVQSYTTLQMPPEGFVAPLPMALVELDQGALILCVAANHSNSAVEIGTMVEIEVDSEEKFHYRPIP